MPLLEHPTDPRLRTIQEFDEVTGKIVGFRVLAGHKLESTDVLGVEGGVARVGDEPIYAFVDSSGSPHLGTLQQLRPILKGFAKRHPTYTAVNLQIAELIGASHEKRIARSNMRELITRDSGVNAARSFYEGSALRVALWQELIRQAGDADAADRIIAVRSRISACIGKNGTIELDLAALSPEDIKIINQESLIEKLSAEFDVTSTVDPEKSDPIAAADDVVTKKANQVLRKVSSAGRQEERIAILMSAILEDRASGLAALRRYPKDRAKVATWGLRQLRSEIANRTPNQMPLFGENVDLGDKEERVFDERIIANLIPRLFGQSFATNRGVLLLMMAEYLGWSVLARDAIKHVLNRTKAMFVDLYRVEIGQALRRSARKRK